MNFDDKNIKLFIVEGLGYLLGETENIFNGLNSVITIKYPFKLVPTAEGSVSVAPVFIKEEWVTVHINKILAELEVSEAILDLYKKYKQKVFSSIILPDSGLKL